MLPGVGHASFDLSLLGVGTSVCNNYFSSKLIFLGSERLAMNVIVKRCGIRAATTRPARTFDL